MSSYHYFYCYNVTFPIIYKTFELNIILKNIKGDMSRMCYTKLFRIRSSIQALTISMFFFVKTLVKFRDLQI